MADGVSSRTSGPASCTDAPTSGTTAPSSSPSSPPPPAAAPSVRPLAGLRVLVGAMLAGYGFLVLVGILAHDAVWAGAFSLTLGLGLLASGLPAIGAPRSRLVALLGSACVGAPIGYALARGGLTSLSIPELAILVYGLALMAAAPRLDRSIGRVSVATAVGWSFPLVLAPLALFASNALLSSPATGAAATPLVQVLVVRPAAWALGLVGLDVERLGSTLVLPTARGRLSLGVGLVCAGLYPSVLFGGLVALHAWQRRVSTWSALVCVGAGLLGLWVLNLVRLVLLAEVGIHWGMGALQAAHANLGWLFFSGFMAVFWGVVLRRMRPFPPIAAA